MARMTINEAFRQCKAELRAELGHKIRSAELVERVHLRFPDVAEAHARQMQAAGWNKAALRFLHQRVPVKVNSSQLALFLPDHLRSLELSSHICVPPNGEPLGDEEQEANYGWVDLEEASLNMHRQYVRHLELCVRRSVRRLDDHRQFQDYLEEVMEGHEDEPIGEALRSIKASQAKAA